MGPKLRILELEASVNNIQNVGLQLQKTQRPL
jgi:hypothetical protein